MTISTQAYLRQAYSSTVALGDKAVSSDATFEIAGFEGMMLLIKAFPWPTLSPGGEIEIPMPLGQAMYKPQQVQTHKSGQVTLMETVDGKVNTMLVQLLTQQAKFNATVYEGTPDNHTRACPIYDAFLVIDTPDRDWENRSQQLNLTGTLYFHYFGDDQ